MDKERKTSMNGEEILELDKEDLAGVAGGVDDTGSGEEPLDKENEMDKIAGQINKEGIYGGDNKRK